MRMLSMVVILLGFLGSPAAGHSQTVQAEPGAAEQIAAPADAPAVGTEAGAASAQRPFSGGPIGANQPRTLRHLWHLFAAYALIWVLLFVYALSIGRRFGRLEAEVRELAGR